MPMNHLKKMWGSSLHRNTIYLMAANVTTAGLGFFFWMICARLYPSEDIGYATAMISAMTLVASFSMLGFNIGLVRFLPGTEKKSEMVSSCFLITGLFAAALAAVFLMGLNIWSPNLMFMRSSLISVFIFIAAVFVWSLYGLTDAVFLAGRKTKFTLGKSFIFMMLKICLPILFVSLGTYGSSYPGAWLPPSGCLSEF